MRLVDADITIKDLLKEAAHQATINHPENARGLISAVEYIKEQPTAYDVDKVVEQLANAEFETSEEPHAINTFRAIEIVKEGAVKDE